MVLLTDFCTAPQAKMAFQRVGGLFETDRSAGLVERPWPKADPREPHAKGCQIASHTMSTSISVVRASVRDTLARSWRQAVRRARSTLRCEMLDTALSKSIIITKDDRSADAVQRISSYRDVIAPYFVDRHRHLAQAMPPTTSLVSFVGSSGVDCTVGNCDT